MTGSCGHRRRTPTLENGSLFFRILGHRGRTRGGGGQGDRRCRLEALGSQALWIVGGGSAAGAFLEAGLLGEVRQFIMPLALGAGTPLFGPLRQPAAFRLAESQSLPNGVLQLRYTPAD